MSTANDDDLLVEQLFRWLQYITKIEICFNNASDVIVRMERLQMVGCAL